MEERGVGKKLESGWNARYLFARYLFGRYLFAIVDIDYSLNHRFVCFGVTRKALRLDCFV